MTPHLGMVHENVNDASSIGAIAAWGVRRALEAGWRVTVIAAELDPTLRADVDWLRLFVPPRVHLAQWLSAGASIRRAIGRRRFDVLHVHQLQAASFADVMQCHFLSRPAREHDGFVPADSLRGVVRHLQQLGVMWGEDACFRRWNPSTVMLFVSPLLQAEFHRHYSPVPDERVLLCAAPDPPPDVMGFKAASRARLVDRAERRPVVAYVGGADHRKGWDRVLRAVRSEVSLFFILAGAGTEMVSKELGGQVVALGRVDDVREVLAAADAVLVPSRFDPFPLVCLEAASVGTPVITTAAVGALVSMMANGAGLPWDPASPLEPVVAAVTARAGEMSAAGVALARAYSAERQGRALLAVYDDVVSRS